MSRTAALKHVALIGLSGVGKSTVGPILAGALGMPFLDTDRETEKAAGMPIHQIFAESGEAEFRALEAEQVRQALETPLKVLSLGGGAVLDQANRTIIWQRATVVWMRAGPEVLARRLMAAPGAEQRPLLTGGKPEDRLRALLQQREPIYSRAHLIVDADDGSPEDLAADILARLHSIV